MTGIALKKPGATLRQHTYGYNAVSNVTSHSVAGVTTTYGYDLADQLTSESRPGYAASYTYDANGNRATRTVNGVTETYVNDVADKLTSISVGGNTVRSLTYDGRGRRKTDTFSGATSTYAWDAESRLLSVARPGVTTNAFGYNGLDARVSKTDSSGTYGFKRNGAGVTDPVLSDGAATYTPGISERRGGNSKFLHSGMKNADAQSGASANVDSSRTYDAFGNLTGSSGSWSGPFGYAGGFGYQEDPDHGLRLLGHRYYDSSTGRFISKDPIGDGRNWTAYCAGNPVNLADATGLAPNKWAAEVAESTALGIPIRAPKPLPGSGLWSGLKSRIRGFLTMVGLMAPVGVLVDPIDNSSKRRKGKALYRVVEEPEAHSLWATDGIATPSPSFAGYNQSKQFLGSYRDALIYQERVKTMNKGAATEIWRWANPLRLGKHTFDDMGDIPVYEVPNPDLPKLGPGQRLQYVFGGRRGMR